MDFQLHPSGSGFTDGPLTPDNYKRAVYRPPPSKFTVEMLGTAKKGGGYSYGMRIVPLMKGDRSSLSSRGQYTEYEVWRRWDDCLWFQGNIELEYRRMARSKRQRLLRGKGVRKDGFYKQDQASSWESLPPGPDPNSVARDIHEHIPMLTKKGTVFRASRATIDQRAAEFKSMIEGLLKDDVPALIEELRNSRIVTDFFGVWRRDHDLSDKELSQSTRSHTSVTSSVFSMYFSSSNINLHDHDEPRDTSATRRPPSTLHSTSTSESFFKPRFRKSSTSSSDVSPSRFPRPRASSNASSDFSLTQSDRSLDSPTATSAPAIVVDDFPVTFNHNPHRRSDPYVTERPPSALAVLPEDGEVCLKSDMISTGPVSRRRRKSSADETRANRRSGKIFFSPTDSFIAPRESPASTLVVLPDRAVRESWQTIDSASCILEGLNMSMPTSPVESHRFSVDSMATFMTDCSSDGVLPLSTDAPPSPARRHRPRISCPVSINEDDDLWSERGSILDTYLADQFPLPCLEIATESRPETPVGYVHPQNDLSTPFPSFPSSPTGSTTFSMLTMSTTSDKLAIKAVYGDAIILLRVDDNVSYKDTRQRIYNKFVGQEGIPLSESFTITFIQPLQPADVTVRTRARSGSVSSDPGTIQEHLVTSQSDWENVIASLEGSKLTLRIKDITNP